jgi:hypothetical protein
MHPALLAFKAESSRALAPIRVGAFQALGAGGHRLSHTQTMLKELRREARR